MPPRSKVGLLPEDVRKALEQKLISSGFGDYDTLSAWLAEQGFEISKSSLHRFGQTFEERCSTLQLATRQAQAIVAATPDDEGAMAEALMRLMQEKLFTVLMEMDVDPTKVNIGAVAKALAPIARASIALKEYSSKVRERARAAADAVDDLVKSGGLDAQGADKIRQAILGIGAQA